MNIIISNQSSEPIYKQVENEIKRLIITGVLKEKTYLPSIRQLASDLGISNITTKRAYEDLVSEGYIVSDSTRGYYVKERNSLLLAEQALIKVEEKLLEAIEIAKSYGISEEKVAEMLKELLEV